MWTAEERWFDDDYMIRLHFEQPGKLRRRLEIRPGHTSSVSIQAWRWRWRWRYVASLELVEAVASEGSTVARPRRHRLAVAMAVS
ncbi:hypothetical protein E4U13_002147 [Claviceps humidiphila]|uniref:Uncharacterized protein n=1 Tax=Claviceps humidiphila TaxID=1294629 RepID=A0A9P7TQN9_9HYPO|nr:hypothetical protein E4U13_002147 [Claviceps humidiphila]